MARQSKGKRRAAKQRNKLRRRQRQLDRKSNEIEIPDGFSTPILKTFGFDNPIASLTEEQRLRLAKSIGETATKEFDERIVELRKLVREHNPLELLATAAVYCLHKGIGPGTDHTEEGPYSQAMVELLQSICLMYSLDEYGNTPVFHQVMFQALDLSKECSRNFALKRMSSIANADSRELGKLMAMEGARLHTQGLRNWGYPQQMRQIERDLYLLLEAEYRSSVGISPVDFLELAHKLSDESCKRVMAITNEMGDVLREQNLRRAVGKFCELTGVSQDMAAKMYDEIKAKPGRDDYKRFNLATYFHQFLPSSFVFTAEHAAAMLSVDVNSAKLETVLDSIAFEFGDLASENPEHL